MPTYTKQKLSGSTDGLNINIGATSTPGTTIHTAHATDWDEIWIYAINSSGLAVKLTIEWGEATSPDGHIEGNIPAEGGAVLMVPGWLLTNSKVVKAFAETADVININGFVNRIS